MGAGPSAGGGSNRYEPPKKKNPIVEFIKGGGVVGKVIKSVSGAIKTAKKKSKQDLMDYEGQAAGVTKMKSPNRFTPESGGDNERSMMNALAPEAPYIVSGITPPTSSPASNWYANLGTTNTNQHGTSIATQYAAAKSAVSSTLQNKGAIGMLAVNDSPYYDWLKTNKIDKGIL